MEILQFMGIFRVKDAKIKVRNMLEFISTILKVPVDWFSIQIYCNWEVQTSRWITSRTSKLLNIFIPTTLLQLTKQSLSWKLISWHQLYIIEEHKQIFMSDEVEQIILILPTSKRWTFPRTHICERYFRLRIWIISCLTNIGNLDKSCPAFHSAVAFTRFMLEVISISNEYCLHLCEWKSVCPTLTHARLTRVSC